MSVSQHSMCLARRKTLTIFQTQIKYQEEFTKKLGNEEKIISLHLERTFPGRDTYVYQSLCRPAKSNCCYVCVYG